MANTKSAKKRARQSEKRRLINLARKTEIKTTVKKFLTLVEQAKEKEKAQKLLNEITAKLARAKSKGVIHRNTASRKLSGLTKQFNKAYANLNK